MPKSPCTSPRLAAKRRSLGQSCLTNEFANGVLKDLT
jgi:hypothetical protein